MLQDASGTEVLGSSLESRVFFISVTKMLSGNVYHRHNE